MPVPTPAPLQSAAAGIAIFSAGSAADTSHDATAAPPSPTPAQPNRAAALQLRSNMANASRRRNGATALQADAHPNSADEERAPADRPDVTPQLSQEDQNAKFMAGMQRLQHEANQVTLANAKLQNGKMLNDAHAKLIRGLGESIKEMAPR